VIRELVWSFWERHADLVGLLSIASILMLVGSLLLVPWLILRAPHDVFVRTSGGHRPTTPRSVIVRLARNVVGACLLLAGLLMLVLPGQGLLTMVVGVCLMDLPRKRELLGRLVTRPTVWRALAWIRHRAGKSPFDPP
jgi:hypothetical protein